jgi:hypothetical protein
VMLLRPGHQTRACAFGRKGPLVPNEDVCPEIRAHEEEIVRGCCPPCCPNGEAPEQPWIRRWPFVGQTAMGREGIEPSTLGLRVPSGASLTFGRSRVFRLGDREHTCHRMHAGWCGFRPRVLPSLLPTSSGFGTGEDAGGCQLGRARCRFRCEFLEEAREDEHEDADADADEGEEDALAFGGEV